MAGTYTVLFEGYAAQSADVGYSFAFDGPARLPANGQTAQDFGGAGLPYVLANHRGVAAQVLDESGDDFLRLTDALNTNTQNSADFSATGSGRQDVVDLCFDFRLTRRPGQSYRKSVVEGQVFTGRVVLCGSRIIITHT